MPDEIESPEVGMVDATPESDADSPIYDNEENADGVQEGEGDEGGGEGGGEGEPVPAAENDIEQKARLYENLEAAWLDNPATFARNVMDTLGREQVEELLDEFQAKHGAAPADDADLAFLDTYRPESALEEVILPHAQQLAALPQTIDNRIGTYHQQIAPYIDAACTDIAILQAQIAALASALTMDLPAPDRARIAAAVQSGQPYAAAVSQALDEPLKKASAAKRQASKSRPNTPGSSGGPAIRLEEGRVMSMAEIFHRLPGSR